MDGLPLALAQAAAYVKAANITLATYLDLFRQRRADVLARGEAPGHPATVQATLELALIRLDAESPVAGGLARLLAFLAPEPIPLTLLLADQIPDGEAGAWQRAAATLTEAAIPLTRSCQPHGQPTQAACQHRASWARPLIWSADLARVSVSRLG